VDAAQAAGIGVVVTRLEGAQMRHLYVSDTAARIFGRTSEEMLAMAPTGQLAPKDQGTIRTAIENGEPTRTRYELDGMRKDGSIVPVEVRVSETTVEGQRLVFAFLVDQREAEEQQARNDARFRELIGIAPEPMGIVRGGRFVYANRAFASALGYQDPSALLDVDLSTVLSVEQADIRCHRESVIVAGGKTPGPQVYRVLRPDGSHVELETSSVPIEYEGQPAVLSLAHDVTARKALERQLVQADRLAAIGTMAAGVAHEINNPRPYVLLNLDWLARTLREAIAETSSLAGVIPMLDDARHGVEHVATIVRQLKAFSRGDTETRMAVDMQAVAQSAIKIAGHAIPQNATIRTAFEPAPLVWANDARLEQVVVNLLINAAQAMSRDRLGSAGQISVSVAPTDDDRVALEVKDDGCGIPPEVLPRIFDPFFTTKPVGVGTGLGLSICHDIVASLGGTITAFSEDGQGTTFRVTLPVADPEAVAQHDVHPVSVAANQASWNAE
jgi:PAS domain S-box-containing protein